MQDRYIIEDVADDNRKVASWRGVRKGRRNKRADYVVSLRTTSDLSFREFRSVYTSDAAGRTVLYFFLLLSDKVLY